MAIDRMQIVLDPRNAESRAVAERAGYQLEGTLRHTHFDRGSFLDQLLFSITRSEVTPIAELLVSREE